MEEGSGQVSQTARLLWNKFNKGLRAQFAGLGDVLELREQVDEAGWRKRAGVKQLRWDGPLKG